MFGLLKTKNPYEQAAAGAYARILEQLRNPGFYMQCSVPDTLEGRFELLLLHLFIIMHATDHADFNQALFDAAFADMDQLLRQSGIGDMGVPKRMRRMMKAFNGRAHAYEQALHEAGALEDALRRNLYGMLDTPPPGGLENMKKYVQSSLDLIKPQADLIVRQGAIRFAAPV
jgi:cytochrome b pre-mRNA-processing protein 3